MGVRPVRSLPHGVTLIELMVVLAISAILFAVGVPMFSTFVDRNRVAAEVNELIAHLALARSEALARRGRVGMCASANPTAPGATCAAGAWATGWIVYVDNGPTVGTRDAGEEIIRVHTPGAGSVTVTPNLALTGIYVTSDGTLFDSAGMPLGAMGATDPLRFNVAGSDPGNRRTVCINATGRARVSTTWDSCA
ncbi:MAG: GspH/FimT family pseudopilin [Burkholderiaceae bacterium]